MPKLVAVDVSVSDDRVSLVFSQSAVAAAYAKYLESEDARPAQAQPIPGYYRGPQLHPSAREVTVALPTEITWFITCRLPDDEDSVTFTFMDADETPAKGWAASMVLFEKVPGPVYDESLNQMHVRRLWNKSKLLKKLDDLRKAAAKQDNTRAPPARQARESRW